MFTEYWLSALNLSLSLLRKKSVVRLTDRLNMTIAVDRDVTPQTNRSRH